MAMIRDVFAAFADAAFVSRALVFADEVDRIYLNAADYAQLRIDLFDRGLYTPPLWTMDSKLLGVRIMAAPDAEGELVTGEPARTIDPGDGVIVFTDGTEQGLIFDGTSARTRGPRK